MNITEQDCINGREAVRRDGKIVKLTGWKRDRRCSVMASDGDTRSPEGFWWKKAVKGTTDLLCWREDLVHDVPDFTVAHAQKALRGDCKGVLYGVEWEASPQGVGYWSSVYNAMCGGEPLPDEARDILIASIAVAKREAETKPAETPEPVKQPLVQMMVMVPPNRVGEMYEFAAGLCGENGK